MPKWFLFLKMTILLLLGTACQPETGLTAVTPIPADVSSGVVAQVTVAPVQVAEAEDEDAPSSNANATPIPTSTLNPTRLALEETRAALPTPTPFIIQMAEGESLAQALATDEAFKPTPRPNATIEPITEEAPLLYFWEMFDGYDPETGLILSDKLIALDGQEVTMQGFMAPPLALDLDWFMLSQAPMGACPFCASVGEVLPDTVLVYPIKGSVIYTWEGVRVRGQLEVGEASDPETGMYSLVRMYADEVETGIRP